jgi:hypothetical protein
MSLMREETSLNLVLVLASLSIPKKKKLSDTRYLQLGNPSTSIALPR